MQERQPDEGEEGTRAEHQPRERDQAERPDPSDFGEEVQREGERRQGDEDGCDVPDRCPSLPVDQFQHGVGVDRVSPDMTAERPSAIVAAGGGGTRVQDDAAALRTAVCACGGLTRRLTQFVVAVVRHLIPSFRPRVACSRTRTPRTPRVTDPGALASVADVRGLRVLVVDDEKFARDDLVWLLSQVEGVSEVRTADSGADALRIVSESDDIDALFLDIKMPGLDGVELVKVLRNFKHIPAVAFVTAYDDYAVDAFDLDVCDYLKKPVDQDRLEDTVRRMQLRSSATSHEPAAAPGPLRTLVGRIGNASFSVDRDDVDVVEAAGDYVRVHVTSEAAQRNGDSAGGSVLVRESISSLTSAWSSSGFVRIHRSYLVRAGAIRQVRTVDGRRTVDIGGHDYPVSRRYTRLLQLTSVTRPEPIDR